MNENLFSHFNEMLAVFFQFVPKIIGFFLLIFIGWIIAKFISKMVGKFLDKLNLGRLTEKLQEISFVRKSKVNLNFSLLFSKVIYYFVFFMFLMAGVELLGIDALSDLFKNFISYLPNVFVAGIILIGGLLLSDILRKSIASATESLGIPSGRMISNFVFYFFVVNVFIIALGQAKIETDFLASNISYVFAGGIFAFALGYGLASKETVSNYLASFYTKGKVKMGDDIQIGNKRGTITEMDKSSITIQNAEGRSIIPLKKFSSEDIEIFN